ncbi:MAG: hypothetical protein V3R61_03765 [candidate division NC10 bacterium]
MVEPTIETLARRLGRVERENQRLKQAGVVALAVIAAVVLMGQATQSKVAEVVEAERFILRDATGKVRTRVATSVDGLTVMDFLDASGKTRIGLFLLSDGSPVLNLNGQDGKTSAALSVLPSGPLFSLNEGGKSRARVKVFSGGARLALLDRNEKPRASLAVRDDGAPTLNFFDGNGNRRATLDLSSDGLPRLGFYDTSGQVRAWLAEERGGLVRFALTDNYGKTYTVLPEKAAGTSRLWVLWIVNLVKEYSMAVTTWPTKTQCEQDKLARLSQAGEGAELVAIVCLPEGINPHGKR